MEEFNDEFNKYALKKEVRCDYDKIIVITTENNIPFYVKCGFDKY